MIVDASKVRAKLGWQHRASFDELVAEMVAADLKIVADERHNDAGKSLATVWEQIGPHGDSAPRIVPPLKPTSDAGVRAR